MPRKYLRTFEYKLLNYLIASMRPGRMPRKYNGAGDEVEVASTASMRPGRMPRKYLFDQGHQQARHRASMRPGRMPRKYR